MAEIRTVDRLNGVASGCLGIRNVTRESVPLVFGFLKVEHELGLGRRPLVRARHAAIGGYTFR